MGGVGLGGVRVDVNEIEVFVKIQKKKFGGVWGGSGGGGSGWGVRLDVNEELKFFFFFGGGGVGGVSGEGSGWM